MKKIICAIVIALSVTNAHARFTADQICDKLNENANHGKQVFVFFDANDVEQKKNKSIFYAFNIETNSKLGQYFDAKVKPYKTSVHQIPYDFKQYDFGRLFTQFFGMPLAIEDDQKDVDINPDGTVGKKNPKVQKYWNIVQLCKQASCKGADGESVDKGGWFMTTGIDDTVLHNQDVYAFLFERKFPIINCLK